MSAVETWKRIRALRAERIGDGELLRRLGLRRSSLHLHPERVTLRTALKIARICRALLMGLRDR